MEILGSSSFWVTLGQIMMINIILSGDNAVVIAMASRSLPPPQQRKAIFFGSLGAILLRVILTFFAVVLLGLPWLKLIGAVLLAWIGIQLLIPEKDKEEIDAHSQLWSAIRTIIVADFIMSLDNVLGVAAAAKGSLVMLILGLALSIPLIIYGSTFILRLMKRVPAIITVGGGVLGWVAGDMAIADPVVGPYVQGDAEWLHSAAPLLGAIMVVLVGMALARSKATPIAAVAADGYGPAGAPQPAPDSGTGQPPRPDPAADFWTSARKAVLRYLDQITRPRYYRPRRR